MVHRPRGGMGGSSDWKLGRDLELEGQSGRKKSQPTHSVQEVLVKTHHRTPPELSSLACLSHWLTCLEASGQGSP